MNAMELNDLAAPLLDRIGWPKDLRYEPADYYIADYNGKPLWVLDSGAFWDGEERTTGIGPDRAACIIQCHIEDRIIRARPGFGFPQFGMGTDGNARIYLAVQPGETPLAFSGPTLLHALVAAGMAACDEQDRANVSATLALSNFNQQHKSDFALPTGRGQ